MKEFVGMKKRLDGGSNAQAQCRTDAIKNEIN